MIPVTSHELCCISVAVPCAENTPDILSHGIKLPVGHRYKGNLMRRVPMCCHHKVFYVVLELFGTHLSFPTEWLIFFSNARSPATSGALAFLLLYGVYHGPCSRQFDFSTNQNFSTQVWSPPPNSWVGRACGFSWALPSWPTCCAGFLGD